ncbi:MAG: alpha/beta hydrolase, partial [Ardenticatenales bacterium]
MGHATRYHSRTRSHPDLSVLALLPALVLAAIVASVPSAAPTRARAQQAPTGRYIDLVFARVTRTNDITYATATDKPTGRLVDLKRDIYEPEGDTAPARPVFVFLFGGGFVSGTKELEPRVYCEQMARRGYVAVAISYRLNQGDIARDGIPAAVSDARQAVRWLRTHAAEHRLDATRIVIGGSSAGAITSLFLAYTDVERPAGDDVRGAGSDVALVMDLWGGLYNQVNDLEAGEPPLEIVHGTADTVVPFTEATKLRDRAEAVGVPYVFHPLEGKGHAPYMPVELMTTLAPFFYAQLWPAGPAGPAGPAHMPDTVAVDRLHVSYEFVTYGRTDNASIEVRRSAGGWHGMATFHVKGWSSQPERSLEATVPVTVSAEAMTTFLDVLDDTPLAASLAQPTSPPMPDLNATFAFELASGADETVGFVSTTWSPLTRHLRPYSVAIGDGRWMTDGDQPDRALDGIYDALRFDELDWLIREFNMGPTAVPSASPTTVATRRPSPTPT